MNETPQQQTGNAPSKPKECLNPARQPPDRPERDKCKEPTAPGKPKEPDKPTNACPLPDCCPKTPPTEPTCLEDLINAEQNKIAQAERAKVFKDELKVLQDKAKSGNTDYTLAKYNSLLDIWKKQDKEIVELIAKLICTAKYWRSQIECFICPLIYEIRLAEDYLYGTIPEYDDKTASKSLYQLRYWRQRDKDVKQALFDRIKSVLVAWENPAKTIEAVLNNNAKLIVNIRDALGATDAGKLVYDVFMHLVPMHLAVAPPASIAQTGIDSKYTSTYDQADKYKELCACDTGEVDDCCGPDVGKPSLLKSLLKPQPYLVHPDQFYAIVCCLAKTRYLPAKDALGQAEADLQGVDDQIKATLEKIKKKKESLESSAKVELAKPFDCCKSKPGDPPKDDGGKPTPPPAGGSDCPPGDAGQKSPAPAPRTPDAPTPPSSSAA